MQEYNCINGPYRYASCLDFTQRTRAKLSKYVITKIA